MPADSRRRSDRVVDRFAAPEVTVVTGAAGWLGTRAVAPSARPTAPRRRVRLLARTTAEARRAAKHSGPSVEVVVGDIAKPDTMARLLHGVGEMST